MVVNPLTHIGGIYGCIGALVAGRKIALLEKFSVDRWVDAVRRNQLVVAPAVPSAVRMLLDADVDKAALASLRVIISGTAPLPPELVDAFHEKYGVPVCGNYGATEMAGAVAGWTLDAFRKHWEAKRGAVGRLHDNMEARIVDPVTGDVLSLGEEGVLEVQGAQLCNDMEWLRTTDRAMLDADRFLWIKGRTDNAIIRGGFKVHPEDVVKAINQHPAIIESAVIGIPDARLGSVPAAAIIVKKGQVAPELAALEAFLKERLIAYQVPVFYKFVHDFPRTPSMKPSAPGLQALFSDTA